APRALHPRRLGQGGLLEPAREALGRLDVALDPEVVVVQHPQGSRVVRHGQVRGHDLPSGGARLEAEIELVAVAQLERLVETQRLQRPPRQDHQPPVQHIDLRRSRSRALPREGRYLTASESLIALDDGARADLAVPPGDRLHVPSPDGAHDGYVRVLESATDLVAEVAIED